MRGLLLFLLACGGDDTTDASPPEDSVPDPVFDETGADNGPERPPAWFLSGESAWSDGPVAVSVAEITLDDPAFTLDVYTPEGPGPYPVVYFFHGFLLDKGWYRDSLQQLASHGFKVVAPQLHAADSNPFGKPSVAEDTTAADRILDATYPELAQDPTVDADRLGLAGHSRGAEVVWRLAEERGDSVIAIVGLDPVASNANSMGPNGQMSFTTPTLILGTGKGSERGSWVSPPCAPEERSHARFAQVTPHASYLVAPDYGHIDLLDDTDCGLTCSACAQGPDDQGLKATSGGLLNAFLRLHLQIDPSALAASEGEGAPATLNTP